MRRKDVELLEEKRVWKDLVGMGRTTSGGSGRFGVYASITGFFNDSTRLPKPNAFIGRNSFRSMSGDAIS